MQRLPRHRRRRTSPARRGVILIVVLGLLALFALVGVMFVTTSHQAALSSVHAAKVEQYDDPHSVLLERALLQLLVGSNSKLSSIGPHGLLEDMYGSSNEKHQIPEDGFEPNDDTYTVPFSGGSMFYIDKLPLTVNNQIPVPGYYTGRVITMLTGAAAGKSSRIVDHHVDLNTGFSKLRVLPFEGMTYVSGSGYRAEGAPNVKDWFLINSQPFNGTGFGYNGSSLLAFDGGTGHPFALTPNARHLLYQQATSYQQHADEDYDIADLQNMALALHVNQLTGSKVISPSFHRPELFHYWVKQALNQSPGSQRELKRDLLRRISFRPLWVDHPGLKNVNPNYTDISEATQNFMVSAYLDPPSPPAPKFTEAGSTAAADNGLLTREFPWDVDNDNDGKPDSIWIDAGFDIVTDSQGRKYKPMIAVMVRDMDGKINLNVHGAANDFREPGYIDTGDGIQPTTAQSTGVTQRRFLYLDTTGQSAAIAGGASENNMPPTVQVKLPVGMGVSAAEVSPTAGDALEATEFRFLLYGRLMQASTYNTRGQVIEGRYGEGYRLATGNAPLAGRSDSPANSDDNTPGDVSKNYVTILGSSVPSGNQTTAGAYATAIDLDGNGAVALDPRGQPLFVLAGEPNNSLPEYNNEPFELDPGAMHGYLVSGKKVNTDHPFGPTDLEFLLRPFDRDQTGGLGLSGGTTTSDPLLSPQAPSQSTYQWSYWNAGHASRLRLLLSENAQTRRNYYYRNLFTTDSWDVPTPSVIATPEIARGLQSLNIQPTNLNILDLLAGKIRWVAEHPIGSAAATSPDLATVNARIKKLLEQEAIAPELLAGLRLDINRPIGNNADDDGNNVVDEPGEAGTTAETVWGVTADRNGNGYTGTTDTTEANASQRLAKHLFVLMMLVKDWKYFDVLEPAGASEEERYEFTTRRLAQWCVNVVDFRDPDNIMTGFEFDLRPFNDNGWSVDGDLNTPDQVQNNVDNPDRAVVWGCEAPEVLITETAAFHDLRVKDLPPGETFAATAPAMPDDDPDQYRPPQGSAFVELFCPRSPRFLINQQDTHAASGGVRLDGMVGDYPVFRLAVVEEDIEDLADDSDVTSFQVRPYSEQPNGDDIPYASMHSLSEPFGWRNFKLTSPPNPAQDDSLKIERIVWFKNSEPGANVYDRQLIFYNRLQGDTNGEVVIEPGGYLMVGPYHGGTDSDGVAINDVLTGPAVTKIGFAPSGGDRAQKVEMRPLQFGVGFKGDATQDPLQVFPYSDAGTAVKPIPCVAAAWLFDHAAQNGSIGLGPIGFNISMPMPKATSSNAFSDFYALPAQGSALPVTDADGLESKDAYDMAPDQPADYIPGRPLSGFFNNGGMPVQKPAPELHEKFRTVLLQRLANPLIDWDEFSNPYITLDWMPMDIYTFNGEEDFSDPNNPPNPSPFYSRERHPANHDWNLWAYGTGRPDTTGAPAGGGATHPFKETFFSTLGYLNTHLQRTNANNPAWMYSTNAYGDDTLIGYPFVDTDGGKPYPWITWNNRPYTNPMELLFVPASHPSRLFWEFHYDEDNTGGNYRHYLEQTVGERGFSAPYGHMLNFFYSGDQGGDPGSTNNALDDRNGATSNYFRALEYLTVPSRFSGTARLFNTTTFAGRSSPGQYPPIDGSNPTGAVARGMLYPYYVPFNRIPTYREPGRVNINGIHDADFSGGGASRTWWAITNRSYLTESSKECEWKNVFWSRKGFGSSATALSTPYELNDDLPTLFANPFRSYGHPYLVPLESMRTAVAPPAMPRRRQFVEASFLRPNEEYPEFPFLVPRRQQGTSGDTVADDPEDGHFNDAFRNPYFAYQLMQKVGNSLTTRSNVYAVWITLGYFEVTPAQRNKYYAHGTVTYNSVNYDEFWLAYPDGYEIVGELGADTGEVKRHRGFFIVDRTIPVAFERGKKHNALDTVVLQRILE